VTGPGGLDGPVRRSLVTTVLAGSLVAALAGCASSEGPSSAAPGGPAPSSAAPSSAAPSSAAAPAPAGEPGGVPGLTGDPTDLTAPTQAGPGTGEAPTELLTSDVVVGTGAPATPTDTVAVRYTGTTWADGELFDSSWRRGDAPVEFPLNGVIPGFAQGIEGMAPGGRRVIVMPADLAYGENPSGGAPGGALVFVVDLVEIA
jgi:peptidylprolyl isomerase